MENFLNSWKRKRSYAFKYVACMCVLALSTELSGSAGESRLDTQKVNGLRLMNFQTPIVKMISIQARIAVRF
jgi:hypothetical protein